MKNLILVLFLVFSLSTFSQEKAAPCVEIKVEKLDEVRVKVIEYDKCKNVITIRTYLKSEWKKIQDGKKRDKRKKIK